MTMKKLTVAAMLAAGIATCSIGSIATASTVDVPDSLKVASCPCEVEMKKEKPCKKKEKKEKPKCGCEEKKAPKCKSSCEPNFEPMSCASPAQPACSSCSQAEEITREDMKQVYAYPNAVYGSNNYVGNDADSISTFEHNFMSSTPQKIISETSGVRVTSENCDITGAAASLPQLNNLMLDDNGIPVIKSQKKHDNCGINIQTESSLSATRKTYTQFELKHPYDGLPTGAAANLANPFPDVNQNHWAACDIDKLSINGVIVGYPDGMFKPMRNVSRAELATMLVKGFNMNSCGLESKRIFSDVPESNWANPLIAKAVEENLISGYPNGKFKPNNSVTRAEALCAISKGLKCSVNECQANEILSKYSDGNRIPSWARVPIATALQNGALADFPNNTRINPNQKATRAEVANMLQPVRVAAGYDKNPTTATNSCPVDYDKQAYLENDVIVKVPTLKLEFLDQVNAKSAHVGQRFAAKTLEELTINGVVYPCGSRVEGKVVEVIRPSGCQKGALKLAFTDIKNGDCTATLPKQILTAQISKRNTPNPVSRLIAMPFTWAGSLVGTAARASGGLIANLGNAVENVSSGLGTTLGETMQGQFRAAGRSATDMVVETFKAPIDVTRTALSGTMGLFQTTGDEFAYLVDPKGYKISAVNPKEHITIAFGCEE